MEHERDELYRVLASGADTGGAFGLVACTLPPFGAGPHLAWPQPTLAGWYVVAGVLALTRDAETVVLKAGELALLRPGESHHCWNPSPTPARLLLLVAPGGSVAELRQIAGGAPGHATTLWDTS
jgi:hypothetical protein